MTKIINLENCDSTNSYLSELIYSSNSIENFTVVTCQNQSKGRGIYDTKWHSEPRKNLCFSLYFTSRVKAENCFIISMATSLAIIDYLAQHSIDSQIKWPNDIYYQNKKLAGILIENTFQGNVIKFSVIGIGLNLNQLEFPAEIPNPDSLINITGKKYDIKNELNRLIKCLKLRLQQLDNTSFNDNKRDYFDSLLGVNDPFRIRDKQGISSVTIVDILPSGNIVLKYENKQLRTYGFKEVEFII